ncbi:hypothetical protein [Marinoscillum sp.]|uniref:hypothetical protein n=1 Tax=Marinoscillum sp. TaxID=2024838 RepID=UPI003BADAE7C
MNRDSVCISISSVVRVIYLIVVYSSILACSSEPEFQDPADIVAVRELTVNTTEVYQTISGFGGANQMWGTQFPDNEDMRKAFSLDEDGLGFSLFRVRIASNPEEWPLIVDVAKQAQSYGAKILASPWSPPAALKSNESDIGGILPAENYQEFVDHINAFLAEMESNGVNIYAVSVQNEPDIEVGYESCDWYPTTMRDFIKNYGDQINAKLAAPESFNFNQSFSDMILVDEAASEHVDIVAGHIYGGGQAPYPLAEELGKEIWMTEYLMNLNTGSSGATPWADRSAEDKWNETFEMLLTMHTAMDNNWNAYIWWYLKRYYSFIGDGTEGTEEGEILKRGIAYSHFSKFIRPGYQRVATSMQTDFGLKITAYHGDNRTVLVIINEGEARVPNINPVINGVVPENITTYVTTFSRNREQSSVEKNGENLLFEASPRSITTVVIDH